MYTFPPKLKVRTAGEVVEYVSAGAGMATVVLVNGSGGPIEGWYKVFEPISSFAKVFAYNRPGIGGSSEPRSAQTASQMVESLREALRTVSLPPPYVLVGHSLGGLIVNLFARLYPSEVCAVVLIEATAAKDIETCGQYENVVQRFIRVILDKFAPSNPFAEVKHVQAMVAELSRAASFPFIPLMVISGAKPAMAWATAAKALAARAEHQQDLVCLSPLGQHIIAGRSGHFPQFTEPGLVVAAIQEAVNTAMARDVLLSPSRAV